MTQPTDRQLRLDNAELLRALVASVDHLRSEQAAVHTQVSEIRDKVITIEARDVGAQVAALALRVAALEVSHQRREGATSLAETIVKSPTLGWIIGAGTFIWAYLTGKVDL